jgi:hypothetical protein
MTTQLQKKWTFETRPDDDPVWSHAVTGDATVERVGDCWELSLTATNEAQQARVDMAGNLLLDVNKLRLVRFLVDVSAIPAGVNARWGLAIANQSAVDDIATRVLFEAKGSSSILLRVDDGVIDSGSLVTNWSVDGKSEFYIDFSGGLQTAVPSYLSKSKKDALLFYRQGASGNRSKFSRIDLGLTNYTLGLQPFFRIDKASGTATGKIKLYEVEVEYLG